MEPKMSTIQQLHTEVLELFAVYGAQGDLPGPACADVINEGVFDILRRAMSATDSAAAPDTDTDTDTDSATDTVPITFNPVPGACRYELHKGAPANTPLCEHCVSGDACVQNNHCEYHATPLTP
jgi:hypothetical protein